MFESFCIQGLEVEGCRDGSLALRLEVWGSGVKSEPQRP